ncbi:MAG: hypothetical protein R3C20_23990 [Planctomycetaceae bacterium]
MRDLAGINSTTGATEVLNHRVFDSYGNLDSETSSSVDYAFGFTGRAIDDATGLYYYRSEISAIHPIDGSGCCH